MLGWCEQKPLNDPILVFLSSCPIVLRQPDLKAGAIENKTINQALTFESAVGASSFGEHRYS
jgi:hypothetical protein